MTRSIQKLSQYHSVLELLLRIICSKNSCNSNNWKPSLIPCTKLTIKSITHSFTPVDAVCLYLHHATSHMFYRVNLWICCNALWCRRYWGMEVRNGLWVVLLQWLQHSRKLFKLGGNFYFIFCGAKTKWRKETQCSRRKKNKIIL